MRWRGCCCLRAPITAYCASHAAFRIWPGKVQLQPSTSRRRYSTAVWTRASKERMAIYAVGDVQGCFDELEGLLKKIQFNKQDCLWFVGDLVNRGPKSLEVLRFVRGLGERAVVVLGNHDLHLITHHEGFAKPRKDDTFADVLDAPDRSE